MRHLQAGRKRRAAPQLMTADRAIMATDRRCSCVSTIILLACLFLSSEMVAANADAEKSEYSLWAGASSSVGGQVPPDCSEPDSAPARGCT